MPRSQIRAVIAITAFVVAGCAPSGAVSGSATVAADGPPGGTAIDAATPGPPGPAGLDDDVSGLSISGLDAAAAAPYVTAAVTDPWVREMVAGHRAEPVRIVDPGNGKEAMSVSIYDYTASKQLRVWFAAGSTTITDRSVDSGQPGFSPREVARATQMVMSSDKLAAAAGGVAYTVQAVKGAFPEAFDGHRVVAIVLMPTSGPSDHPLIAYADLSAGTVAKIEDSTGY